MLVSYLFGKANRTPCFWLNLALITTPTLPILLCIIVEKQHKVIEIRLKINYKTCFYRHSYIFKKKHNTLIIKHLILNRTVTSPF